MKKENNNVFQILFGKFSFLAFLTWRLVFQKGKTTTSVILWETCRTVLNHDMSICCRVIDQLVCYFFGGKKISIFFFPFLKMSRRLLFMCCVMCGRAHAPGGCCVYMLTSLAWRIVRRVNGQSSPAASQCTQSLLIIRQHLVSVSFLKFCFLLFKPRKLFLCQTPILILCFCFTTSSQKRLKNVDRNSCCRSCCWSRRKIAIRLTRRCFTSSSQIIPTRNNHVLYRSSSSSSTYVQEEMYIV